MVLELKQAGVSGSGILREVYPELSPKLRCEIDRLRVSATNSTHLMGLDRLLPDVVPTLERLRRSGLSIGLVTRRPRESNEWLWRLDLQHVVDSVINSVANDKDAALTASARACGAATFECLAVGDSPSDLAAAQRLGMRTVGASYGLFSQGRLAEEAPNALIQAFSDLPDILDRIQSAAPIESRMSGVCH